VHSWFSSSDGADVTKFCDLISEANQDRLESEGGICIVYAHFACGFAAAGEVDARAKFLLRRLARKNGWFVPVSTLLDHLANTRGVRPINTRELRRMELHWLADHIGPACSPIGKLRKTRESLPELSNVPA
jgi:hypothetical protein